MVAGMANTFATRLGPGPFSQLVTELQCRHHAELELIYLAAAEYYGFEGDTQVPSFSKFDDPTQYAGSPPSVQFCKAIFTDWFAGVRLYMERSMATLPGTRLAGDHTFNVSPNFHNFKSN